MDLKRWINHVWRAARHHDSSENESCVASLAIARCAR
jgi:hypothetical protein